MAEAMNLILLIRTKIQNLYFSTRPWQQKLPIGLQDPRRIEHQELLVLRNNGTAYAVNVVVEFELD